MALKKKKKALSFLEYYAFRVSAVAQDPTAMALAAMEGKAQSPAQHQWVKGSSVATAVAWIQSLAQKLLYARVWP